MRIVASANPQVRRRRVAPAGSAFVGPIDGIGTPIGAYSLRRLLSTYTANKAVRVRRLSDNVEADIGFTPAGLFDLTSFAIFVGGLGGTIVTWYDQSSGTPNDLTQGTQALQPTLTPASGIFANQAVAAFTRASGHKLANAAITTLNQPYTLMGVSVRLASTAAFSTLVGVSTGGNPVMDYNSTANTIRFTAGVSITLGGVTDTIGHCIAASVNGASSRWCLDGVASAFSGTPGAAAIGSLAIGTEGGNSLDGQIAEVLVFNSNLSDGNMQTIQADQKAFYGTP